MLFTKQESLIDFIKCSPVEILLYGDDTIPEAIYDSNVKYIFHLCKERKPLDDKHHTIFKYQSAGKIKSDILSCYTRLEDNQEAAFDSTQFISVFAPVSGAEKQAFSWLFAKELSNKRKVLFISLDMLSAFISTQNEENRYALSEYLYYLKEGTKDHISKLKSYLNYSEKLSYLSGLSHGFDLLSISKDDVNKFIDEMKEHKDYERIVFYLGIYTEASMEILKRSSKVFLTICDRPYEEEVIKEWKRQMELMGSMISDLKYRLIKLPVIDQAAETNSLHEYIYESVESIMEELTEKL